MSWGARAGPFRKEEFSSYGSPTRAISPGDSWWIRVGLRLMANKEVGSKVRLYSGLPKMYFRGWQVVKSGFELTSLYSLPYFRGTF